MTCIAVSLFHSSSSLHYCYDYDYCYCYNISEYTDTTPAITKIFTITDRLNSGNDSTLQLLLYTANFDSKIFLFIFCELVDVIGAVRQSAQSVKSSGTLICPFGGIGVESSAQSNFPSFAASLALHLRHQSQESRVKSS